MSEQRVGESGTSKSVLNDRAGFTLVELSVSMVVISILVVALFGLFITLVRSATLARQRAVGLTLANNQMENLKSLPYDNLVVIGGSIIGTGVVPASTTQKVNGATYTVKTNIDYADDAFDGCGNIYSSAAQKVQYCRGATTTTATNDTNPADYKDIQVRVLNAGGTQLASVDTQVAARVSETASNTAAFVVTVVDGSGTPVPGATVALANGTVSPTVNASDTTDTNGTAIFYKAPPDSDNDYVVTATKAGYSSVSTIAVNGSLQPTYPNQKAIAQQASAVTLRIYPMTANSLAVETTDTSGTALGNIRLYAKGGYKKYTATTDTTYYYDAPTALTTDGGGQGAISNLVPANGYFFCGDAGSTGCTNTGGTAYYLAAAVPYAGSNSLGPITVPINDPTNPPATTFAYGSTQYVQKVRLMLTTNASFPRVFTMNPYSVSASGSLTNVLITLTGYNLSGATTRLTQGSNTYTGTGCSSTTTQLKCTYNLTGVTASAAQLSVTNGSGTLTLPTTPLGGFNVTP